MPLYEIFNAGAAPDAGGPIPFASREEVLQKLGKKRQCDVLVVGGGIHGAALARLAAFNGLRTVLLEKKDYAAGASGSILQMVYGWPQYRRFGALLHPRELKAQADLFGSARHLVRPQDCVVGLKLRESWAANLKLSLLMRLSLLMSGRGRSKYRRLAKADLPLDLSQAAERQLGGGLLYEEGLLNGSRLVIENIISARQEGADCLNYAQLVSQKQSEEGGVIVGWNDLLSKDNHEILAGVVVNCAGGWVPNVGRIKPGPLAQSLKYQRVIYALFAKKWGRAAQFVPAREGGDYLIASYLGGTVVAMIQSQTETPGYTGAPSELECLRLIEELSKDCPDCGLGLESLVYAWAGVEALTINPKTGKILFPSGKERWSYSNGVLSLLGGDFGSANWTVFQGLKKVFKLSRLENKVVPLIGRNLPGAGIFQESVEEFRAAAKSENLSEELVSDLIDRLGSRVRFLPARPGGLEVLSPGVLRGEVELAIEAEQAETLEDVMSRRLCLEFRPNQGCDALDPILKILGEKKPHLDLAVEKEKYLQKIGQVRGVIGKGK